MLELLLPVSNGKFTKAIVNRVNKASRAIFIVRKAITTVGNVNVKLACNIFDKQIQPIMIYGCPIWGLPHSNMCLYLDNIPNNIPVLDIKNSLQNLNYKIEMYRRVGKQTLNCRPILIKVHNIDEKIKMFHDVDIKTIHPDVHVRNYDIKYNSFLYEKTHSKFCKFVLNVSKYSSTSACMAEMGRYPLSFKIWSLCIKYWMRLANDTNNVLLNNAFQTVKEENHEWLQNIKYLLNLHGFGKQWNNPIVNHEVFIKHFIWTFRKRLEDQYIQFWENKCLNSELYNNIHILNNTYCSSKYLDRIKIPSSDLI